MENYEYNTCTFWDLINMEFKEIIVRMYRYTKVIVTTGVTK